MLRWSDVATVALAGAAPAVVTGGSVALRGSVDNTNVALAVAVVIVLAASWRGLLASASAAVSGAVTFDLFQTKPYGSLRIAGARDAITTILLLAVGALAGWLAERQRAVAQRDRDEGRDFAHLQRFGRLVATETDPDDLIAVAEAELLDLLGLVDCRFEPFPFETTLVRLERLPSGRHKVVVREHDVGPGWGPDGEVELPVEAGGHQLGRFVLVSRPGAFPLLLPRHAREVAFALVDRLAQALLPTWAAAEWSRHAPHPVS